MKPLVVLSHTYVEEENRGKLRALASAGPVVAVVPRSWSEGALRRRWRLPHAVSGGGLEILPVRWLGPHHPSAGLMCLPPGVAAMGPAVLQIEEEPWTPTAYVATRRRVADATLLFTWENVARGFPPPWRTMQRRVFARIDGLIAGSSGAAEVARAQGFAGPLAIIPQLGVELPPDTGRPDGDGALRLAFVGRLVRHKGLDLLLRAMSGLDRPWTLTVVGDGPERPALERLAGDLSLGARVAFLGARPHRDVATLWRDADVLVLPSRSTATWREQLGHVLLEAMAHGVAVVGSSCGAIPEAIGDAGLVFPEEAVDALGERLARLAGNRDFLRRLAAAGRRRVEADFTNARIAERTRAFHAQVLEPR